jgi:selenocysteine lyase/cysteine desulfurase
MTRLEAEGLKPRNFFSIPKRTPDKLISTEKEASSLSSLSFSYSSSNPEKDNIICTDVNHSSIVFYYNMTSI